MAASIAQRVRAFLNPSPMVRRFDAAAGGRRWQGSPNFGRVGTETLAATAPIRARARYFSANNAHATAGVNALTIALIGAGITPASKHPDESTRATIGAAFAKWARDCDADGRTDLAGLCALAVRAMVTDGESFLQFIPSRRGLKLRLLPAEMVDESMTRDLDGGAFIVGGVEFSASGERVAYHISPARPTDQFATYRPPVRVPASEILHLMVPLGAGQVRGVSWLAPVLLRLAEIDGLEDAILTGFRVAALHAGFLIDTLGSCELPYDGERDGSSLESGLEPGVLKRLPAGLDVKFNSPLQAQQSVEFLQSQLRAVSAGLGVPEFLLTNDVSRANYSSLRAALIAFKTRVEQIQWTTIIPQMIRPIYKRSIATLVLSGEVPSSDFESRASDYLSADYHPPALPWADPLKDIQATREALDAGLTSRRRAVAEVGWSVEELDSEIAADREREKSLGLSFVSEGKPKKEPPPDETPQPD